MHTSVPSASVHKGQLPASPGSRALSDANSLRFPPTTSHSSVYVSSSEEGERDNMSESAGSGLWDEERSADPPASIYDDTTLMPVNASAGRGHRGEVIATDGHLRPRSVSPSLLFLTSFPLEAAPLGASSVQSLEQQYDLDTWRMFHRIQSSRSNNTRIYEVDELRARREANHEGAQALLVDWSNGYNKNSAFDASSNHDISSHSDEPEAIFELDLEDSSPH